MDHETLGLFDEPTPPEPTIADADLRSLELLGLDPFPLLKWDAVDRETGKPAGKRPRDTNWRQHSYTRDDLRRWCGRGVRGNAGARLANGQIVLDWDPRNDPQGDSLERLCHDFGIPRSVESITGTGGRHVFLRVPIHTKVRKVLEGYPGIDVKTDGGYVVAAGSRHPAGPLYRWAPGTSAALDFSEELGGIAIPAAPAALVDALEKKTPAPSTNATPADPKELARIVEAIAQLDPAEFSAYGDWLHLGMELHDGTGGSADGLDAWIGFCARIPGYESDAEECRAKWDTFTAGNGRTVASLYDRVRKGGGSIPAPVASDPEDDFADELVTAPDAPQGFEPRDVMLSNRQRDAIVDDVVAAVAVWNDPPRLFRRAGGVMFAHADERGRPAFRAQTSSRFLDITARAGRFYTQRATDDGFRRVHSKLPQAEAGVALERLTTEATLPAVLGIAEAPVMRPDGSLLERPGYDASTRLYAAFEPIALDVPEHPTQTQVEAARDLLLELVCDFPFVDQASRANALAALLTMPLRPMFPCAPLFGIDATTAGTGKTLLVDAIATVALGRKLAAMTLPEGEEEIRKTISAELRAGTPATMLDNVTRPLEGASLCALLTSSSYKARILGITEMLDVEHASTWFATGNNLTPKDDMVRRFAWIRIDAQMANPETRAGFRHRLPEWALAERPRLLGAIFTLARAWIDAGRPKPTGEAMDLGGSGWWHTIGGVLEVAGVPGFLGNRAEQRVALDEGVGAWSAFLAAWAKALPGPVSAKRLALAAAADEALREAVPDELGDPTDRGFAKALSYALRKHVGRRFPRGDGVAWAEKSDGMDHSGVVLWRAKLQE